MLTYRDDGNARFAIECPFSTAGPMLGPSKYPMPGNGDPIPGCGLVAPTAGWAAVVAPTQASTAVPTVAGVCTTVAEVWAVRALPEAEAAGAYIRCSPDSIARASGTVTSAPAASTMSRPPWKPMPRGRRRQDDNVPALNDLPGKTRRSRPRGMGVPHWATPKAFRLGYRRVAAKSAAWSTIPFTA
jgi:hypothetical protein